MGFVVHKVAFGVIRFTFSIIPALLNIPPNFHVFSNKKDKRANPGNLLTKQCPLGRGISL